MQSPSGSYFTFRDPAVSGSVTVVADYAAALTWAFGLLAYVSAGAFMSPAAVVLLLPAVLVTIAASTIRRRTRIPAKHRSGPAHAR